MLHHPSPNRRPRQPHEKPQYIILHGTWMANDEAAIARLCDPATQVSAHYLIKHDGMLVQLVDESDVAWHAGKSTWNGLDGLNPHSIGIELGNAGPFQSPPTPEQEANPDFTQAPPYTEPQYETLIQLLRNIMHRHPHIHPEHILGHSEVSPGRKSDPGLHFDWNRLTSAGVALPRPLR